MLALRFALVLALLESVAAGENLDVRLEHGWRLFDAGRNAEAAAHFARLLETTDAGCAAARGLSEARRRACRPGPATPSIAVGAVGLQPFLAGQACAEAGDFAAAAVRFREAALATTGDPRACAAALLEATDCLLQQGRFAAVDSLSATLRDLLPSLAPLAAARVELALRVRSGGAAFQAGRLATADSLYACTADDALAAGRTTEACDALNGRGTTASRQRRVDASRGHYVAALELARRMDDVGRRAKVLLNLAYDQTQARAFDAAEQTLNEARVLVADCGRDRMSGRLHVGLGAVAEGRGDREGAVQQFREASRKLAAVGDRGNELGARQRLAYNLTMAGRYGEAIQQYERALALADSLATPQVRNWVLAGLALANHRLGQLERADHFYRRSMAVSEELGDRMSVALCRQSLGMLEVLRGNYRQAMVHHLEALEICTRLGDQQGIGDARVSLADLHFRLGDWDLARTELEAAAAIARANGLEELLQSAVTGLASVCTAAEQPARARAYCEEGLAIARRWQDRNAIIWALVALAEQTVDAGDRARACALLLEAQSLLWPHGPHVLRARARLAQARCAEHPRKAIELATTALEHAEAGGLPELEWTCLSELGLLQAAGGDTVAALAAQARAITVIESLRRNVGSDELRLRMLRPTLAPYERMVDLLVARGAPDDFLLAFAYAERAKAQVLSGRLRGALAGRGETPLAEPQRELLARIAHLQQRLQQPELPDSTRANLRQRVTALEAEYLALTVRAPTDPARLQAYALTPPDPQALAALPRQGEHVVAYFLGREHSWMFHVAAGQVTAHVLPPRDQTEDLVRRYVALRESNDATPAQLTAAGRRLHALLLQPALVEVHDARSVVLVPDGLLHRLPFAALGGDTGTLASRCPSYTVPSLQTLDVLRRREADRHAARGDPAIAMVAVGYGGPGTVARMHPWQDRLFAPLQHADTEARQVAALFRGARLLTGESAGERALGAAPLREAGVLHLAAHGDADDREVRRSFVLLGRGDQGEDGLLQWNEAASLDLGTSLVTLASCRSARGPLAAGEGVTGLTQAFLFAGASCVLAAQTDVGDAYSRRFMLDFYRQLRDGDPAAEALRHAQLAAAADDSTGRAAWADFVLVGDGSVTVVADAPTGRAHLRLLAIVGIVGGLVLAATLRRVRAARAIAKVPVSFPDHGSPTG